MQYYHKIDENFKFHFFHIPRTGGRHVRLILKYNNYYCIDSDKNEHIGFIYAEGRYQEIMHLTAKASEIHYKDYDPSRSFAIIRNPVDKFVSGLAKRFISAILKTDENLFQEILSDPKMFKNIMSDLRIKSYDIEEDGSKKEYSFRGISNNRSNWFSKQINFVTPETKLWKFENGFGEEFYEFLRSEVGLNVDINIPVPRYNIEHYDKKENKISIEIDKRIRKNLLDFYKEDYEMWLKL
jgi:hypothetical protein